MLEVGNRYPTTDGGMQKVSSVGICSTRRIHGFRTFGTDLYVQLALINKISASELSQKLIKSELLVGSFSFFFKLPAGT